VTKSNQTAEDRIPSQKAKKEKTHGPSGRPPPGQKAKENTRRAQRLSPQQSSGRYKSLRSYERPEPQPEGQRRKNANTKLKTKSPGLRAKGEKNVLISNEPNNRSLQHVSISLASHHSSQQENVCMRSGLSKPLSVAAFRKSNYVLASSDGTDDLPHLILQAQEIVSERQAMEVHLSNHDTDAIKCKSTTWS